MPELVVQMGHVARRKGATGTTGEQDYARRAAAAIEAEITSRDGGWTVSVIHADPVSRTAYAGDAFVAIHCDGAKSPSAHGASVGYRTPEGAAFGDAIMDAYEAHGWTGGFRDDNYTAALRGFYGNKLAIEQGNPRAVIVEAGFLTNPDDRAALMGPDGASRLGRAVADALGVRPRPMTTVPGETALTDPADDQEEDDMYIIFVEGDPAQALISGRFWHALMSEADVQKLMEDRVPRYRVTPAIYAGETKVRIRAS